MEKDGDSPSDPCPCPIPLSLHIDALLHLSVAPPPSRSAEMPAPAFIAHPLVPFRTSCRPHPHYKCSTDPPSAGTIATGPNPRRLAKWLAADWSNKDQAIENPTFWAHIHVCFRPLPWSVLDGYALYCESAYDYSLGAPYKSSVVLIVNDGTGQLELESYKINDPEEYWLGAHEPSLLEPLNRDCLVRLDEACNTVYMFDPKINAYVAGVRPRGCIIRRGGTERETWLDSKLMLSEHVYTAWDLGRDLETDDIVWGPKAGAFRFEAIERMHQSVPDEPLSVQTGAPL